MKSKKYYEDFYSLKELKENILANYYVDVVQVEDRLWIPIMEDQTKNILIDKWDNGQLHVSSGNEGYLCDCEETVLYCLMKFIKDKHKWGDFKNAN